LNGGLAPLAAALLLSACTVHVTPEGVLFQDDHHPALAMGKLEPTVTDGRLEPLTLRHADGVVSRGVHWVKPGSKTVIVYFSGNKMRLAERGPSLLPRFALLDADLFWLDYRGLGASDGQPSLETLQSDAVDLLELAGRARKPIILHGLSMGSLLAGRVGQDPRVAALVLEGGITSVRQVAEVTTPGWLRAVVGFEIDPRLAAFDNLSLLARYERPLLVLVGSRDEDTPPVLSQRLYDAARSPGKRLVIALDKTHRDAMTSDVAIAAYRALLASLP